MAEHGWQVRVLDAATPGSGGSGNAAAILYPKLVSAELTPEHIQSQAFLHTLKVLEDPRLAPHFQASGVLWLQTRKQHVDIGPDHPWWQSQVWSLNAEEASAKAGVALHHPALWLPNAGLIHPEGLLARLLAHKNIELLTHHEVTEISPHHSGWHIQVQPGHQREPITLDAKNLVLAVAGGAQQLLATQHLPLKPVRGQITTLKRPLALKTTLCYGGYLTPGFHGQHVLGATFQPGRSDTSPCHEDQLANASALLDAVPSLTTQMRLHEHVTSWSARASVRWQTPDYLPMVGWLPWPAEYERLLSARVASRPMPEEIQELPKVGISLGHGSKGFSQAWLAADLLCQALLAKPEAQYSDLQERLRPDRFLLKAWKRGQLRPPTP